MASTRNPALTGVRAIAALAVCMTHAAFWTGHYTSDYPGRLFSRFEIGVAIFFVLSGYLLFRPWVRSLHQGTPAPSIRRFAWHRARRILPAYWVCVIGIYLLYAVHLPNGEPSATGTGWSGLLRNLTLTQVYGLGHLHAGLTQMWSLAAEVVYYVCLPGVALVLLCMCRRRWRPDILIGGLVVLMLVSPAWAVVVAGSSGADPTARLWAPAFSGWFVGGMLLATCAPLVRRWPTTGWVLAALGAFLLAGIAAAGEPTITPTTASATIVKHVLYLIIAVGLVGPLTAGEHTWWSAVCGWRPMVWLGEISYELFCVHVVVLELVMETLGYRTFTGSFGMALAVTVLISVPLAWALHRSTAPLWRARTPGEHRVPG